MIGPNVERSLCPRIMRIVIDTNVFIAAIFRGDEWARAVLRHVDSGACQACMSLPMVVELGAKVGEILALRRLDPRSVPGAIEALVRFIHRCERVTPTVQLNISPDPSDNKFFECAVAARCDYIISMDGDDMLGVVNPPVLVLSPWQFCVQHLRRAWRR